MKFLKLLPILIISAILASCAGTPVNIGQDATKEITNSKIAVAYFQMEKRINHNEELYRVFWWDQRDLNVFFDGLWDIDKDLSAYMAPKFSALGLNPTSLYQEASTKDISEFHDRIKENLSINQDRKPFKLNESMRQSPKKNNIGYLVTVYNKFIYTHTIWGVREIRIIPYASVIDVSTNEEKYPGGSFYVSNLLKDVNSTRELENNNLAGLKIEMKKLLDQYISRYMPEALGLVQEKNNT